MGDMADMLLDQMDVYDLGNEDQDCDVLKFEKINKTTDKARSLTINGKDHWLPKSECIVEEKEKLVTIPHWLISKRGIT